MTLRYLLDTNVLSEPLRPEPSPKVMRMLEQHTGALATASVAWGELVYGLERMPEGRRKDTIGAYLDALRQSDLAVLPFDQPAADWQGRERARLEAAGVTRPFVDSQIAAVAWRHGLTLVSRNTRDFDYFSGIDVEDWFA